jgi:hypothetical protein
MAGTFVDYSFLSGTPDFEELTKRTLERFDSRERQYDRLQFDGIEITRHAD